MIFGLLLLVLVGAVVVLVVRRAGQHEGHGPSGGHTVRRFFQYLLLFGLLIVSAIGLSGLLGRLLGGGEVLVADDQAALARSLAFTVVGVPLFAGVALWSRRRLAEDPDEARSLAWASYVTGACLVSLLMGMTGLSSVLDWATGLMDYDGDGLAQLIVWGGVWGVHWWIDLRVTPEGHRRVHHLAGSLIGLTTAASGLGAGLAAALRVPLGLDEGAVIAGGGSAVLQAFVPLVVGAPVWWLYWVRTTARTERDPLWLGYVLLVGVGGGLVTAVVSASTLLYSVLVWLVGDPGSSDAAEHFRNAPGAAAAVVVGALVWWYHQAVLEEEAGAEVRTEVRRIYEYLLAAIGLLAAAAGLTTAVVAIIEALTRTAGVLVGRSTVNTLLAAATLLVVGGPVWWLFWRQAQKAVGRAPVEEVASPTRRFYLFVLFGLGGVAAVVALLVGVYLFFEDVVQGTVGAETLRRMRYAIGVLITTAAIAGYHWTVYRADRAHLPVPTEATWPRFVLLVGPADTQIAHEVQRRTHAQVRAWARTEVEPATWSADDVLSALGATTADEVIVLAEDGALRAIPVHRG